jgi:hypothetical protein
VHHSQLRGGLNMTVGTSVEFPAIRQLDGRVKATQVNVIK